MIRTTCPQCGREDAIADYLASLPVMCKKCGHRVTMGEPIAPTKPVLPPATVPAVPLPPLPPPKAPPPPTGTAPPAKPQPQPQAKPESAVALIPAPPADPTPAGYTNGEVVPRPEFLRAAGREVVDLFEEPPAPLPRPELHPPKPVPSTPAPVPLPGTGFHRGRRFAARLVTLVGVVLAIGAGILLVGYAPPSLKRNEVLSKVFLFLPLGLYALYNVAMLGTQGQDFGKRVLGLRIVGDDGTPAKFGRAFLKRELVVLALLAGVIPLAWRLYTLQQSGELAGAWQRAGWKTLMPEVMPAAAALLFSLLNALLVFNPDGKCIHDRLAKTRVTRG